MSSSVSPTPPEDWRERLDSIKLGRLKRLEKEVEKLEQEVARLNRPPPPPPEPELTDEQIRLRRESKMNAVDINTWVKAISQVKGHPPMVLIWNPLNPLAGNGIGVLCDGLMVSKTDPNHLSAKALYAGDQVCFWGQRLSDLLAILEPASEEQWNQISIYMPDEIRKDKPPKKKKKKG